MTGLGTVPPAPPPAAAPVGVAWLLRSEWTKLRSVNSTWITLLVTAALGVGLTVLICFLSRGHLNNGTDPTAVSLASLGIAQLALAILGVLTVTGEYSAGTIRVSLMAVPRRGRLLAAKWAVLGAVCLVTGEVIAFAAFLIGQAILHGHGPSASLGGPSELRAVVGAGLYLAFLGLLGCGIGTLVRSTAGAIAIIVAFVFVVPGLVNVLPGNLGADIDEWWPTEAGAQVFQVGSASHVLSAWDGFALLVGFVLLLLVVATVVMDRRDA